MLGESLDVYAVHLMLPNLQTSSWSFGDMYEQILYLFVVDLDHGDLHLVAFVGIRVVLDPHEDLFTRDGHNTLVSSIPDHGV